MVAEVSRTCALGRPLSYLRVGDLHFLEAFGSMEDNDFGLTGTDRPDDGLGHVLRAVRGEAARSPCMPPARNLSWNSVAVTEG